MGTRPRKRKNKSDQLAVVKSPYDLSANFFGDNKEMHRDQLCIRKFPNVFLQVNTGIELLCALALSDHNLLNCR
jgi:hypothetical protein